MASTYSKLKIELIGTGDQAGQWGTTTNNNLGSSSAGVYRGLEQAIVGMATISSGFVANSYTLPYTNSNDDQEFRCLVLNITASLSNPSDLIVPAIQKPYIVINSSGQTVTVKVSGQTGVAVPNGAKILLYNTGTDVGTAITYLTELKLGGNLTMPSAGSINDSNGNELIKFPSAVASAVNELTISNAATGSAPTLSATGGDTNIGITLTPKGTGTFLVTGNTTLGDATSDTITLTGTVQPGVVISGSSSGDALRITQTGAGNALLVEDAANPDSTPFVVTAAGDVGIGTSSPQSLLNTASTGQVQIGTSSWPTSLIGKVNARTIIGNEGVLIIWNEAAATAGNEAALYIGPKGSGTNGSTIIAGGYVKGISESSSTNNGALTFGTNSGGGNSEKMRLDSSGNLGIGTTSPGARLDITEAVTSTIGDSLGLNIQNNNSRNAGELFQIGMGNIAGNKPMTVIGTVVNTGSFYGNGDIFFATRSVTTDTAPTERARITSGGNVGIGTTSPGATLHVTSTSANQSLFEYTTASLSTPVSSATVRSTGTLSVGAGAGIDFVLREGTTDYVGGRITTVRTDASSNQALAFYTGGSSAPTERARITSGGDLLVGTDNSSGTAGAGFKTLSGRPVVVNAASANTTTVYEAYSTGASAYRFYVGMGGTIYATSTTITAISDQRLKENIQDIDVGLNAVMALKPRKFDWKEGKGKNIKGDRGWIAQEFEQVFPDMITTWKDEPPEGEEPYKAVNADLIPVLVKAIQEQQTLITSLTARVAALEGTQP